MTPIQAKNKRWISIESLNCGHDEGAPIFLLVLKCNRAISLERVLGLGDELVRAAIGFRCSAQISKNLRLLIGKLDLPMLLVALRMALISSLVCMCEVGSLQR